MPGYPCCCVEEGGCTATTAQQVAEYIRDNGILATLVVSADDYTDACGAGDCSALAGSYTPAFDSISDNGLGTWAVEWVDTYTITTCGVSRTITVRIQLFITPLLASDFLATLNSSLSIPVRLDYENSFPTETCDEILGINDVLDPVNASGSGRTCYTLVTDGSAGISL